MKYARINNGSVTEICTPIAGFRIEECFHADLVNQLVACGDDVQVGWAYTNGAFVAPTVAETTETTETTPAVEETVVTTETTPSTDAPA